MVATIAAGTSTEYYLSCADYYMGGAEPSGRWIAVGVPANAQPGEIVERAPFEQLHGAIAEDGSDLLTNKGGKQSRVGGYDVTFSAPKSCSIIWALADDDLRARIEDAQAQAVVKAIEALEKNAAFTRSGKNGIHRHKAKLTVAAFQHGEARPARHADGEVFADCALHHHAVVMNLSEKSR
jgi:conjugative relaxase-like TrwC/TraI family protein